MAVGGRPATILKSDLMRNAGPGRAYWGSHMTNPTPSAPNTSKGAPSGARPPRAHEYRVQLTWTGNRGEGTASYTAYGREHEIAAEGRPTLAGSADPAFRGDPSRYSPEDLLVASLSACHMLWYLHLCADAGVVVTDYRDEAYGRMDMEADGRARFTEVVLRPRVTLEEGTPAGATGEGGSGSAPVSAVATAGRLHREAHRMCFIARSVNFPVRCEPRVAVAGAAE